MKERIKFYDKLVPATAKSIGCKRIPVEYPFEWYRGDDYCEVAVFTDQSLDDVDKCDSKVKIALLMESPEIFPKPYRDIVGINKKFDYVLTFDQRLLALGENYKYYTLGGCWIEEKDWYIYNKTKRFSMVASHKKAVFGHLLRHKIFKFSKIIDIYGTIENSLRSPEYKLEGLKDYAFSFAIENCQQNYYFTEKLIDCFLTGTVPIYWGGSLIAETFEIDGIIIFDTFEELDKFFWEGEKRHFEMYRNMEEAIVKNFYIAKEYAVTERVIYDKINNLRP